MLDKWKSQVVIKPKLRTYITFKNKINTEPYVNCLMSKRARSLFTQFRHVILPLRIETGRFRNLPVEQRICELCELDMVEDEVHFLCTCPFYVKARLLLFNKAADLDDNFVNLDVGSKFVFPMKNVWKEVSKCIIVAWDIRQNVLYRRM